MSQFFYFYFFLNLYIFLLFLGFSAKISTKYLVPIFENSQGQCPRKDFRIFPVLSGFIRILISCPKKKINFLFLFFVKNLYFFLLFWGFSAKIGTKNLVQIFENSQGQCPRNPIFLLLLCINGLFQNALPPTASDSSDKQKTYIALLENALFRGDSTRGTVHTSFASRSSAPERKQGTFFTTPLGTKICH